jgi:hypothetical protein
MPNNVELVRLRKLRVRDGVLVPSMPEEFVICAGGWSCDAGKEVCVLGGDEGAEGGGEESSKGRLGLGSRIKPSLESSSESYGIGWLMVTTEKTIGAEGFGRVPARLSLKLIARGSRLEALNYKIML